MQTRKQCMAATLGLVLLLAGTSTVYAQEPCPCPEVQPESCVICHSGVGEEKHQEIYDEWKVSAHRYSAMDAGFQKVQSVMGEQNGPESTRYCGGCHDPSSLFAGTKNVFTEDLSSVRGYNEGVSCLVCHSIRETDLKGPLRAGAGDGDIREIILKAVAAKEAGHRINQSEFVRPDRTMSSIGG